MIKILILIAFGLIIYNMGKALFNLVSSKGNSKNLLKALALRVLFSISLFYVACIIKIMKITLKFYNQSCDLIP